MNTLTAKEREILTKCKEEIHKSLITVIRNPDVSAKNAVDFFIAMREALNTLNKLLNEK